MSIQEIAYSPRCNSSAGKLNKQFLILNILLKSQVSEPYFSIAPNALRVAF